MPRRLAKPRPRLLASRVALGFEVVHELIELVEIDPGLEPESVRNGLRRRMRTRRRKLAKTDAKRSVDHVFERQTKLARAPPQKSGQIVIDSERGAHGGRDVCE